ncbi:unnamed protein product [Anisakis simplex]|uniref:DUF7758 domain-containing protein n=1 Tax=Anisakis simplex TaxID=6269 RepID=A0A0M3K0U9_ANISI|nr:unnamed protein product [Anisakis simplex]
MTTPPPTTTENKSRDELFEKAKTLNEEEKWDDAMEQLKEIVSMQGGDMKSAEIELMNWVVCSKITSAGFGDEKKDACNAALELIEPIKVCREAEWLINYEATLYECFSKLNSCVRDEERENAWCKLKECYLEVLKASRRVWKEKNQPERLAIYVNLSKLSKFYLDVADLETIGICEEAAKEAKFIGRGILDDEQFQDASTYINEIKKNIADAQKGKEHLKDD